MSEIQRQHLFAYYANQLSMQYRGWPLIWYPQQTFNLKCINTISLLLEVIRTKAL